MANGRLLGMGSGGRIRAAARVVAVVTIASIRRFWQSIPHRLAGTHIGVESEPLTSVPAKAVFVPDEKLEAMVSAARGVVLARGIQVDKPKVKS